MKKDDIERMIDMTEKNLLAGADIHAGDGGYSIGTRENYEAFVKVRNRSLGESRVRELWAKCVMKHHATPMNWQNAADDFAKMIAEDILDFSLGLDLEMFAQEGDNAVSLALHTIEHHIITTYGIEP